MALVQLVQHAADVVLSPAFRHELARTLVAWGVLFAVGIWMVVCQQWSDMRWVQRLQLETHNTTLPLAPWPASTLLQDQLLDHLPVLEHAWISDKLVGTSVIVCIAGCSLLARSWRSRMMLVRRIGWMVALLYFVRSVTISVTTVPPSTRACEIAPPRSTWEVIAATPDILAGNVGQCTDKIFSGHTAILVISFLFWRRYATHWAFLAYSAVHTTVGIASVLMARYHYTVDVVIALMLTYFIHHAYYAALTQAIVNRQLVNNNAGAFDMDVLGPPKPEDAWDRDSAMGVDISSNPATCVREQLVRKREPTSSVPDSDSDEGELTPRQASSRRSAQHDEIEIIAESLDLHPGPRFHHHVCSEYMRVGEEHHVAVLGINRPFGAILPAIVAWMDGLDIRIET
ncbi:hypothetical protein IWW50_000271 [Coemansia erecta]|nr:hypothetical protein GGF43_000416 [Coemansia sp. RSA 2618]KAJ2830452.1 hypothetical protein IWW50_000271 [Coemansia erecta]